MTPRLVFRPQAESELLDAKAWYEHQRRGLGQVFATAVDRALAANVEHPLAYPRVHGETRRALVRRFPYAIYFRAMSEEHRATFASQPPRKARAGNAGPLVLESPSPRRAASRAP